MIVLVALFVLFWTITIGSITYSLIRIRQYFNQKGLSNNFNGKMMALHCVSFVTNYSTILLAIVSSILVLETTTKPGGLDYDLLFKRMLLVQLANLLVQVTNTLNRPLIFYVFWKFANQCQI